MYALRNLLGSVQKVRQGGVPDSHKLMDNALMSDYAEATAQQYIMTPTQDTAPDLN